MPWKYGSPCSEGGLESGSPGGRWPPGWFPGSQAATYRAHWSSVSPVADRDEGGRVKQQRASERGKKAVVTRGCSHTTPCSESESCSVMSNSLRPHGLHGPWNSPGQNTGVGSLSLLQGILPTQGLNSGFPHCGHILYQLSHQGSWRILEWVFSRGSSRPRNRTRVSCTAGGFFTNWAMREALVLEQKQLSRPSGISEHSTIPTPNPWGLPAGTTEECGLFPPGLLVWEKVG